MTIAPSIKKRAISAVLTVVIVVGLVMFSPSHTSAAAVPIAFVETLLKALPELGTVIGKLFKTPDDSDKADKTKKPPTGPQKTAIKGLEQTTSAGKTELAAYAKREQVIWRLVASSSQVSRGVSALIAETYDKTTLTAGEVTHLTSVSKFVSDGIDTIVKSGPKSTLFLPDTLQVAAINDLTDKAPGLAANVTKDLEYSATAEVEKAKVTDLHTQLAKLDAIFMELDRATAAEIEMIATGLSTVSSSSPPKSDDTEEKKTAAIKAAVDGDATQAFTNVHVLDMRIRLANQDFTEAYEKNRNKNEEKF